MGAILESLGTQSRTLLENAIEQRCRTVAVTPTIALTRVLGELLLYVDTRDLIVAPHLLMTGYWEFWVTQAIARHVKPGMQCLDVGSNAGYYTALLGALVGPKGHVEAFDLQPEYVRWLRHSATLNGHAHVEVQHRAVVGPGSDPTVAVVLPTGPDGVGRLGNACLLGASGQQVLVDGREGLPGRVAATTLDEWIPAPRAVDFIKIDVEGAEPQVWDGSAALRARCNPVVCMEYEGWRPGYPEFLARVRAEGYQVRFVDYTSQLVELPAEPEPSRLYMLWVTR